MSSPRGQSGLEAKRLASASRFWPRPGLDLVVLLCNRAFFVQKSVKSGILLIFPAIILNHMLLIIIWYFFHNYFWPQPQPQPHSPGLSLVALASASKLWPRQLGLGLEVLASFNITASNPSWQQAAILDNFEWPYLRNGSFDPLI